MNAFLAKPYTLAALQQTLAGWLQPAAAAAVEGPPAINRRTLDALRELDEDGSDLVAELIHQFQQSAPADLARIEDALAHANSKLVGQLAHALKSSAANLGADALARCYAELEKCGRQARLEDARALLSATHTQQRHALAQLQDVLAQAMA